MSRTDEDPPVGEVHKLQFAGTWCPPAVHEAVANGTITAVEAWILMVIDSLVDRSGKACFASNQWLAKRVGLQERTLPRLISHLKETGFLMQVGFDGRKRYLCPAYSAQADSANLRWQTAQSCAIEDTKVGNMESATPGVASSESVTEEERGHLPKQNPLTENTSRRFQKTYFKLWEAKYKGKKYPFQKKDGAHIKQLFKYFKADRRAFKALVVRYLQCEEAFFRGHPVSLLVNQMAKFITANDANPEPKQKGLYDWEPHPWEKKFKAGERRTVVLKNNGQ